MIRLLYRTIYTTALLSLPTVGLMAQAGASGSGFSNFLLYGLIGVAILVFLFLLINVSDNLLVLEARKNGVDTTGSNFGLFPKLNELFRPNLPTYLEGQQLTILKKGYDINLAGSAAEEVVSDDNRITRFAVQPPNFIGLLPIPKVVVEEGASVKAGDPLFYDKKMPDVKFAAPVSGEVIEIKRGAKRAIIEVVILADKKQEYRSYEVPSLDTASREELMNFLLDSGAWPMFRQRPFNTIATPHEVPRDIFISTFDSAPLAPDFGFLMQGNIQTFQQGLDVLTKLTDGRVFLGLDGRGKEAPSPAFTEAQNVEKVYFRGPHPSGNVGIQIHHIAPIGTNDKVWTLGVQEVITLGELFLNGRLLMQRYVAIAGSELAQPQYIQTYLGANIGELLANNVQSDNVRLISGDVLSGEQKTADSFLNFYDDQLTVIEEGNDPEMFGWLLPLKARPSISPTFPTFFLKDTEFKGDTNTHGEVRAFVVTNDYEAVMPVDIMTQQLMKAILVNDFERMEGLGIHELVEEDVALAEFSCVSKQPLQQILRRGLETMREQA